MPERPTDTLAEVLEASRLRTLFFGRFVIGAPWALSVPAKQTSSFYIVAGGAVRLAVDGVRDALALAPGDLVLLPHGVGHRLDDGSARGRRMMPVPSSALFEGAKRLGGTGAESTLISGCFRFSAGATHPFLRSLPALVAFPKGDASPLLRAMVEAIALESGEPSAGSSVILARLTDVLLVLALRARTTKEGDGLRALADPAIAASLAQMHAAPGAAWTVEGLATAVGLSRSGFAARFQDRVGEAPLRYLTRWRMMKASTLLAEGQESVDEIAARLGYESRPAFQKAFKRLHGVGPGAFRRAARLTSARENSGS